jgi:Asp/Glu/hydantoin racemase
MIPGATAHRIVMEGDESVMPEFVQAGKELEAEGVRAITTSCGYLTTFQEALINAVNIPVFTSSLLQVPMVSRMLRRGKKVGILTIDSRRLTEDCLKAAGITGEPIVVMGSEEVPDFYNTYPRGALEIDPEKVEKSVIDMVRELLQKNPDVGAIVCEAINYAPYAAGVQEATGLPWFDIVDLTKHVYSAVVKRRYTGFM